ncbi:MAG: sulfatase-like hydrolase/transferase [Planctomycetota bacterium]|nr:sulfatase-like hydrolase/transferase [Planctomycetota bacterium]
MAPPLSRFTGVIALVLVAFSFIVFASNLQAADRPNIVWLISEDNSIHYMDLYDEHGTSTPRIAELARHGLQFQNAFSNAPVCSVARTTLMTSCYGPRIGTQFHRRSVTVPMPSDVKMFPAYLREADYYTTNNQKKDYNAVETEGTWDASNGKASWRGRREGQPFFHMQSFGTTHESSLHFSQNAYENKKTKTDPSSVFVQPYFPQTDLFRYTVAKYHDNMQAVDQQIGAVVDRLKEDGLLDDTFIFYFGDHGGVLPRGKGYAYESGLHVPLVVYVPENFKHLASWDIGSKVDSFVEFIDFGATTLNLASVEPVAAADGKPFLGEGLKKPELDARNSAFGYADRFDEKYDLVRTLRVGNYEYIRNYQPFNFDGLQNNYRYIMLAYREWRELYQAGELNKEQSLFFETRPTEQLFDIESDPYEVNDLAQDPNYASVLKRMRKQLQERVLALPDLSFIPESMLAEKAFDDPVAFGRTNRGKIAQYINIADMSLLPIRQARAGITLALSSNDPIERYWALIACSCFGEEAASFEPSARSLLNDKNLLVRTRAAEFLALIGKADPAETLMQCLKQSESGIQTNLILNTAVLLRDGKPGYDINVTVEDIHPEAAKFQDVRRRLAYFAAKDGIPQNPRGVQSKKREK